MSLFGKPARSLQPSILLSLGMVALLTNLAACAPTEDLPENLGYLRSSDYRKSGQLTVFNADTFEIIRRVKLPKSNNDGVRRIDRDDRGRIWISYSQYGGIAFPPEKQEVWVFSPAGELEHKLEPKCGPIVGVAFANNYAFILCLWTGFEPRVLVVDPDTMEVVRTLEDVKPQAALYRKDGRFFALTIAAADDAVLVYGSANPPRSYQRLTNHSGATTMVARISPRRLAVKGYNTDLEPGVRVRQTLPVGGREWMLNSWSHLHEHPPRTDVYVLDPGAMEIVDSFNLPQPYPKWGSIDADGTVYVLSMLRFPGTRDLGAPRRSAISRVDPVTLDSESVYTDEQGWLHHAQGIGVYQGAPLRDLFQWPALPERGRHVHSGD